MGGGRTASEKAKEKVPSLIEGEPRVRNKTIKHTEHLFTRLLRTGCGRLELLLQNDVKIILLTHSQKTIYLFNFYKT